MIMSVICDKIGVILDNLNVSIDMISYVRAFMVKRNKVLKYVNAADYINALCARLDIPLSFKPTLVQN